MGFIHEYISTFKEQQTKILECVSGKKKWLFYFVNGELVQTKSNLKQEQTSTLQAENPLMSDASILLLQAQMRIAKAILVEEIHFKSSSNMPSGSINTFDALCGGMAEAYSEEELLEICSHLENLKPKLLDVPSSKDQETQNFCATLKGNLRSPVCISNFEIATSKGWSILWMLQELDLLEEDEEAQESLADLLDFDLGALLAEEVAKEDEIIEESEESEESESSQSDEEVPQNEIQEDIAKVDEAAIDRKAFASLEEFAQHAEQAKNHFELLNLPQNASSDDVRNAFFSLSKKIHPDLFSDRSEEVQQLATDIFDKVREAQEVLSQPESRQKYIDHVILGKATEEEIARQQLENIWKAEDAFKKGERIFHQGQLSKAHEFFTEAHECDPNSLEIQAYYGYTTFNLNRTSRPEKSDEGIELIKEALQKNEAQEVKLDGAWVLLARAYREKGDEKKAMNAVTRALRIKPSNLDAQKELNRLRGKSPSGKAAAPEEKKGNFFSRLFGGKK